MKSDIWVDLHQQVKIPAYTNLIQVDLLHPIKEVEFKVWN